MKNKTNKTYQVKVDCKVSLQMFIAKIHAKYLYVYSIFGILIFNAQKWENIRRSCHRHKLQQCCNEIETPYNNY